MTRPREGAAELTAQGDEIEVVDHDPGWKDLFLKERELLARALGPLALEIHHVGSTAVPELAAKPVIDIMVAVGELPDGSELMALLVPLGYVLMGSGDADRLFFRKGLPRTHHVHIMKWRAWNYYGHLWFRDYLIDHASAAEEYECLKRLLASRRGTDREAYLRGKEGLISMIMERAVRERVSFLNRSV